MFSIEKLVVSIENLNLNLILHFLIIFILITNYSFPQIRKEQFKHYTDTTEALRIKNILPVDVKNYINVGGTFHGLINQIAGDEATIFISDSVTATTSIPTNITLYFTAEGLLLYPSGRLPILGDVIAPRKKIFSGDVDISLSKVSDVCPEWFGAKANDVTDDKEYIEKTIEMSLGKNISLVPYGEYLISDTLNIYLWGRSLSIYGGDGTTITSTKDTATYGYYNHPGILRLRGGDVVDISNVKFRGNNEGVPKQSDNVLVIEDSYHVMMEKVVVVGGGYAGVMIRGIEHLEIAYCTSDSNMYAGTMIVASKHTTVIGGSYSHNGSIPVANGYGIILASQYGTGINNEDAVIKGVRADYNLRKGIDVKSCDKFSISENFVNGFVYAAINAVHEGGENYHYKTTRSAIISHNIIENDSAWFASLNFGAYLPYSIPIQFGSYRLRDTSDYSQLYSPYPGEGEDTIVGSWICSQNQLKNCSVGKSGVNYLVYMINGLAGKAESMILSENTLENSRPKHALYIGTGNDFGYDRQPKNVKLIRNTLSRINSTDQVVIVTAGRNVEIAGNSFDSCSVSNPLSGYGIQVSPYGVGSNIQFASVHNNTFTGAPHVGSYPITWINVANNIAQSVKDNFVYGMLNQTNNDASVSCKLPDMLTKSHGEAEYTIELGANYPDTIKTMYVPAYTYADGTANFEIEISTATSYDTVHRGTYNFTAWARNNSGLSYTFTQYAQPYRVSSFDDATFRPSVFWSGSDTAKTLMILCPHPWSTYKVKINFNCWRLTPYQREES